jgi:heptose-I-phosphate ethanolaminephosphotransferase
MDAARAAYPRRALVHAAALLLGPAALGALRIPQAAHVLVFYAGALLVLFALGELAGALTASRRYARWERRAYAAVASLVLLLAAIHADNTAHYGALVTDSVDAVFQTDVAEALRYVLTYTSPAAFVLFACWSGAALATLAAVPPAASRGVWSRTTLAALGALGLAGAGAIVLERDSSLLVFREAAAYRRALRRFATSRDPVADRVLGGAVGSGFRGNVVVGIGESTGRHHLGLYGYFRNTTPRLSARRVELALFTDAIATHSHTVPSLMDALSFNDRHARRKPRTVLDVITLANHAGFTTAWLSNQSAVGVWNNLVSILARRAHHVRYHSESGDPGPWRARYDEEMLASLDDVLARPDEKKLIFVHLMATHSPYCEMIPAAFRSEDGGLFEVEMNRGVFGDALTDRRGAVLRDAEPVGKYVQRLNCYDSAVRYVDAVLDAMIARLEQRREPSVFLYFSDHGEAPLLGTGHDSRAHSHFHVEIPLIVWMNEAYRRAHPETASALGRNVSQPVSLIDLSFAIADVAGIAGVNETARRSFLASTYEPFDRTALHGRVEYDRGGGKSDPVEEARARLAEVARAHGAGGRAKLWAHRVNSLGAALEARELFAGLEVDVVYHPKRGEFFVHHPPARNLGLRLEDFLRVDDGRLHYWFDWKNATAANLDAALARLEALDGRYGLKRRAIVETGRPNARTAEIAARGWMSSYYLPTGPIRRRVERGDEAERKALAERLLATAERHRYGAVSFDLAWRSFFDGYLREGVKARGLRAFGWTHHTAIHESDAIERLGPHVADPAIEVVLVGFASPFDL